MCMVCTDKISIKEFRNSSIIIIIIIIIITKKDLYFLFFDRIKKCS